MRPFEQICAEVDRAITNKDVVALQSLSQELIKVNTPRATAMNENVCGSIDLLTYHYENALLRYERAQMIYDEIGDKRRLAKVLSNIGSVYLALRNLEKAFEYYQLALDSHTVQNDRSDIARIENNLGLLHQANGKYAKALESYDRSLAMYLEEGDRSGVALVSGNIGGLSLAIGDYDKAAQYLHRALDLNVELGNTVEAASAMNRLGIVHVSIGSYPRALELYNRARALYEELNCRQDAASVIGNIGVLYRTIGDYARALEIHDSTLAAYKELNDQVGIAYALGNIGAVHMSTGAFSLARQYTESAISAHRSLGDQQSVDHMLINLCQIMICEEAYEETSTLLKALAPDQRHGPQQRALIYMLTATLEERQGELDCAHRSLNKALAIAEEARHRDTIAKVHQSLRDLAQKRNDFAGYIEHNNEFLRMTEEIRGQEAIRKLSVIEAEKRIEAERAEKEKHKALLYNTLPPTIADRVLRGETVNDSHDMAAVMFMDMVGFTTMSSTMDPGDVVFLLSQIFTTCDAIMAEHGLMKIKTIGDSYMAVAIESNTEDQTPKTTEAVNSAAKAAVQLLRTLSEQHPEIRVRIGLHCGPVTAGVIGTERLQYDVWGDTVNVASRMESHGEPGRIHVSEAFATALVPGLRRGDEVLRTAHRPPLTENDTLTSDSLIPSPHPPIHLSVISRGTLDIKGKGPMTTYWLEGA